MADSLVNEPTTLAPLPPTLHRGLVAVAVFGFLSFLTSLALLFRLGYRLVTWKRKSQARVNHFTILLFNLVFANVQGVRVRVRVAVVTAATLRNICWPVNEAEA
ncbi:hypothetical protein LTR35_017674 [Friedmanniomyces endolithicus]|nr:hypothetical protein LTR35_017674 [Friedmanniomyces endolithicus]